MGADEMGGAALRRIRWIVPLGSGYRSDLLYGEHDLTLHRLACTPWSRFVFRSFCSNASAWLFVCSSNMYVRTA